ncbi:hypothetical protein CFP65_6432 [Kitasatospora sp. MMS16-BH015]|nr:hypothetical protein CFP65_6432 [Kitasatospora sp. MMS16-BH015]
MLPPFDESALERTAVLPPITDGPTAPGADPFAMTVRNLDPFGESALGLRERVEPPVPADPFAVTVRTATPPPQPVGAPVDILGVPAGPLTAQSATPLGVPTTPLGVPAQPLAVPPPPAMPPAVGVAGPAHPSAVPAQPPAPPRQPPPGGGWPAPQPLPPQPMPSQPMTPQPLTPQSLSPSPLSPPPLGAPPPAGSPLANPPGVQATPGGQAPPAVVGGGARGRILVVEGGYGGSAGRRPWGRAGAGQAPVLSAMLAAVSPQILLAAEAVDAVHLPGAADPQSVLAHLRAASRHVGPLVVHLGGHLVADRRGEHLYLTLRDSKPGTVRQDGLPWQAIADELRHRSPEWDTLVIADLSADQSAWPQVQSAISPLMDGVPLWAAVSPDPEQIGTFTRALIESLHRGTAGAGEVLAPEQLRGQVHSVLRPDAIILSSYPADRPVFRNTARRGEGVIDPETLAGPRPAAVMPKPPTRAVRPRPGTPKVQLAKAAEPTAAPAARPPVTLLKAGVPPTPPRPARPVSLLKSGAQLAGSLVDLAKSGSRPEDPLDAAEAALVAASAGLGVPLPAAEAEPVAGGATGARPKVPLSKSGPGTPDSAAAETTGAAEADYRERAGRIVASAEAGEHQLADELARELEELALAAHGPVAAPVLQARQLRAHVARLAGRTAAAAELYREVALTLLRSHGPEHPETQQAATNAEACWRAVEDRAEAIRIAPEIIELRAHLPGPDGRKLRSSERYLKQLVAAQQS